MGISYKVGAKQYYDEQRSKNIHRGNEKNFISNESVMIAQYQGPM